MVRCRESNPRAPASSPGVAGENVVTADQLLTRTLPFLPGDDAHDYIDDL